MIINDNKYYFRGYPSGNMLKIFCKILEMWHNNGSFPINFIKVEGLKDQTASIVELLNTQNSTVNFIFNFLKENNIQGVYKIVVNFLESIGLRGFMTILGFRMTPGSCEGGLPKKSDLYKSFNAIFKKEGEDKKDENSRRGGGSKNYNKKDDKDNKYITKITVGARALSKHSDRTNDNFWGNCNGNELERNINANEIFNKIMNDCVWMNIHYLPHSNKIFEVSIIITLIYLYFNIR